MGEEAEEGRPPGDGSKGRRAPANRSVSADTSSHPCRGPSSGPGHPVGGAAGGGRRRAPAAPPRAPGRLPWQQASLARPDLTIGRGRWPLPRPLRRPGRALALGGSGAQGHTHSLPRWPASLLDCSTQRDTIHDWPPKPGWGSPGSRLGPAPKPAPSRGGASER